MQDGADEAAGEGESSDEETSDSSSSSSDDESVAAAPAGRQAGLRGQDVGVSLQVSPTRLVLQWHDRGSPWQLCIIPQTSDM